MAPLPPQLHRPPRSLRSLVAGYKSAVTTKINNLRGTPGKPVWQRNYYEHVIWSEKDLDNIRFYIQGIPDAVKNLSMLRRTLKNLLITRRG